MRRAKDKYGRTNGSSGGQTGGPSSNGGMGGNTPEYTGGGSKNWDSLKGVRLEHPEDGHSTAGGSVSENGRRQRSLQSESVDDIPLVAAGGKAKRGR